MCNFPFETLDFPWDGHLAHPIWTGKMPIPQDFKSSCTSRYMMTNDTLGIHELIQVCQFYPKYQS